MEKLPITLQKNGFTYTQVLRGQRSCIYRQTVLQNLSFYEVFEIRTRARKEFKGVIIPAKELFPFNEAFGYWAWTYLEFDRAKNKFDELENG